MSITAYRRTLREVESPRQIERRLLATITSRLDHVAESYDRTDSKHERLSILAGGLRDTLIENQRLWSMMKYDLSDSGNALPADLRGMLLSLALWVEKTTAQVLGGGTGVRALTEVNNNIVAALTGQMLAESA